MFWHSILKLPGLKLTASGGGDRPDPRAKTQPQNTVNIPAQPPSKRLWSLVTPRPRPRDQERLARFPVGCLELKQGFTIIYQSGCTKDLHD